MPKKEHELVPLMFQAQVEGRSQIQRLIPKQRGEREEPRQQVYDWVEQWENSCAIDRIPQFDESVQTRSYQFSWRMVTNSGQDQGVMRPVIGAKGWAFFPGSSMKGAFLRACRRLRSPSEVMAFCGGVDSDGEMRPGCLRFHGGYPENGDWLDESLVDIVHPQEDWQLKGDKNNGAFIQVSLYEPKFKFGISSGEALTEEQWNVVWEVWRSAVEQGLGSRVSAGYGQVANHGVNKLIGFNLAGQGMASRQIDKKVDGEFRPNLFKATLRSHTRRLLNGIVDSVTADRVTQELWGGIGQGDSAVQGLLGIAFSATDLEIDWWSSETNRRNTAPIYEMEDGSLEVLLMRSNLSEDQRVELKQFVQRLMQFSMLLGGFGKSWRRADHRLFMPHYKDQMIGCHWSFAKRSHPLYVLPKDDLSGITRFIDDFVQKGRELSLLGNAEQPAVGMREAWRKENVQVWGRLAEGQKDCRAIGWLHGGYETGKSIKKSDLTGEMGRIGRLWHRMYPWYEKKMNAQGKPVWKDTGMFVELLTLFPNVEGEAQQEIVREFLGFLDRGSDFRRLW